jgi:hypothetical protein
MVKSGVLYEVVRFISICCPHSTLHEVIISSRYSIVNRAIILLDTTLLSPDFRLGQERSFSASSFKNKTI